MHCGAKGELQLAREGICPAASHRERCWFWGHQDPFALTPGAQPRVRGSASPSAVPDARAWVAGLGRATRGAGHTEGAGESSRGRGQRAEGRPPPNRLAGPYPAQKGTARPPAGQDRAPTSLVLVLLGASPAEIPPNQLVTSTSLSPLLTGTAFFSAAMFILTLALSVVQLRFNMNALNASFHVPLHP